MESTKRAKYPQKLSRKNNLRDTIPDLKLQSLHTKNSIVMAKKNGMWTKIIEDPEVNPHRYSHPNLSDKYVKSMQERQPL